MWKNCVPKAVQGAELEDVAGVTHNFRPQLGASIAAEEKEIVHEMKDDFHPGLCFALITMSQLHNCMRVDDIHTQDLYLVTYAISSFFSKLPWI